MTLTARKGRGQSLAAARANDRRYASDDHRSTRRQDVESIRQLVGVPCFDLDVATWAAVAKAPSFYTKRDNALVKPWWGHVWCNPPYSNIGAFVTKAWAECQHALSITMLIPATRTEQAFWVRDVEPWRDGKRTRISTVAFTTHFLPGRLRFGSPLDPTARASGHPPFGCVVIHWRNFAARGAARRGAA